MAYRTEEMSGTETAIAEVARFLAAFVRDGELGRPRTGDDQAAVWEKRMHWWWNENPFCRDDSPRGFVLRIDTGEVVGFSGLIPFDYEVNGEIVPSLILTTFFVREEHRSAVMGLLSRQRTLVKHYQLVDGSPSEKMMRLLQRLGYRHSGERHQYFFPLARMGGEISRAALRTVGWSFLPNGGPIPEGGYLSNSPAEIATIPALEDGKLRRLVSVESLEWLCRIGTEERRFFGLCDREGRLQAYAIGVYKTKWGMRACLLMDYVDFSPDKTAFTRLLRRLLDRPIDSGIHPETDFLAWSVFDGGRIPGAGGLTRDSILHYQLPKRWENCEKACVPFEGDIPLL